MGLYWDNGKENGNYYNGLYRGCIGLYWGYIGIMDKKMETTILGYILGLYRGYIGILDKKMEATIVCWGNIGIMENKWELL